MPDDDPRDMFGYPLYGGKPQSVKESETSKEAAARMPMIRINALHMQIKQFLTDRPKGATDEEMQTGIPMPANTQRPRRIELTQLKQVVDSGYWRLTKTRRKAVVWVLKQYRDKALEPLPPLLTSSTPPATAQSSAPMNAPRRPLIPPKVPLLLKLSAPAPKPQPKVRFQLRGVRVIPGARCPVCYQTGGKFEKVTYAGAPDGGLPVHTDCLQLFFADMINGRGNVT